MSSILALILLLNAHPPSENVDRKPGILHEPTESPQGPDADLYRQFEEQDFYK